MLPHYFFSFRPRFSRNWCGMYGTIPPTTTLHQPSNRTTMQPLALLSLWLVSASFSVVTAFAPTSYALPRLPSTSLWASALIVQNKGGGHGELGYQLAKVLENSEKIDSITILQDAAAKESSEPFKSYSTDLPNVKIVKAPLGEDSLTADSLQALLGEDTTFDYVWDNASKNAQGAGKAVCDCAKAWNVKLLTYVSSAGMYQPPADGPFPMPETTPVKESAGQNQYDQYAVSLGLPLVSFRPQYICKDPKK